MADSLLQGDRLTGEQQFIQSNLNTLNKLKVKYGPDYIAPASSRPRKAHIAEVPLQPPPAVAETSTAAASNLTLEIKCSKPPLSFSLDCPTTSTIAVLKQQLRKEQTTAPLADDQRWLLKGKVMADTKLLRDYDITGPINLMLKPGATYPPKEEASNNAPPMLRLNTSDIPPPETIGHIHDPISTTEFQAKVQQVQFWQKTLEHLRVSFDGDEHAAIQVWEQWFGASKHWLTPNLIAKIREDCNVLGMGGQ